MFDTYVLDRRARSARGGWFATSLFFGTALCGAIVVAMVAHSYWQIARVTPKYQSISFMPVAAPPEPPAAAAAPPPIETRSEGKKERREETTEIVQIKDDQQKDETKDDPGATPDGAQNGVKDGQVGGTGTDPNGALDGDPNGIPNGTGKRNPPQIDTKIVDTSEKKPVNIPLNAIAAQRTAGRERIPLSNEVKLRAVRDKNTSFSIGAHFCLDTSGAPTRISLVKSSGYSEADDAVLAEIRNWRFQPYTVNGQPVPVCTAYLFQYVIE